MLGLLIDAKRSGSIPAVAPVLDQLEALRFRLAGHTRNAVRGFQESFGDWVRSAGVKRATDNVFSGVQK